MTFSFEEPQNHPWAARDWAFPTNCATGWISCHRLLKATPVTPVGLWGHAVVSQGRGNDSFIWHLQKAATSSCLQEQIPSDKQFLEVSSLWHTFFKEAKPDRLSLTQYQSIEQQQQLITPITANHWGTAFGEAQRARSWELAELCSQTLWIQHPHDRNNKPAAVSQKESPWSNTLQIPPIPQAENRDPGLFYVSGRAA